jgi:hypothetical protein
MKGFKVGEKAYIVSGAFFLKIEEEEIYKSGVKYVETAKRRIFKIGGELNDGTKYLKEKNCVCNSPMLFPTKEAAERWVERRNIVRYIGREIELNKFLENVSLEDLRKISEILHDRK